jgi:hypothetical protein
LAKAKAAEKASREEEAVEKAAKVAEAAAKKAAAAKADVERREAESMHSAVIAEVYPRLSGAWTAPLQPLRSDAARAKHYVTGAGRPDPPSPLEPRPTPRARRAGRRRASRIGRSAHSSPVRKKKFVQVPGRGPIHT